MSTPTSDQILAALNQTGFILEHRVAQALRGRKFVADINHAYPDPDTGKSREIDVDASLEHSIKREPVDITLTMELVIECKSGLNPFVLVGERGQSWTVHDESVQLSFDPFRLNFKSKQHKLIQYELKLTSLPGAWQEQDFVGYQLIRMNQHNENWRADNNSIYDSIIYPLSKAWRYRLQQNESDEDDASPPWQYLWLDYTIPVIVTAGPVFIADITGEQAEVKEVGWACLRRRFNTSEMWTNFRADVVNFAHFDEYLDARVLNMTNGALDTLRSNIHLFDPEWLLANLGEPEDKETFNEWLSHIRQNRKKL